MAVGLAAVMLAGTRGDYFDFDRFYDAVRSQMFFRRSFA